MSTSVRAAAVVRAGLGLVMLTRPDDAARLLGAPVAGQHPVLRILGLRHLAQATALALRPDRSTTTAACLVDGTHILSCFLLAGLDRAHRRPAVRDAGVESGVLLATWLARP